MHRRGMNGSINRSRIEPKMFANFLGFPRFLYTWYIMLQCSSMFQHVFKFKNNIFQTQMVQPWPESCQMLSGSRGTWPGAWAFGAFRAFQVGAKVGAKAGAGAFQAPGPGHPGPPWWQRMKIEKNRKNMKKIEDKYFNKDEERWWYER